MINTGMGNNATAPVGELIRGWRRRRRLSQMDLGFEADVSARHISFLETGRSRPSREMLLRLAERLDVPLRDRNGLLLAAGFAPIHPERSLDDPALGSVRQAVDLVLAGHEPFPALAVDRHWTLVAANRAVPPLLAGAAPELLRPPVNVLRLGLHPAGLAPRIANLAQWRGHLLERLRSQADRTADPALAALLAELEGYPAPDPPTERTRERGPDRDLSGIVVPLRLRTGHGELALFGMTTLFGTPLDVTLAELAIESFFPADAATADVLRRIADGAKHVGPRNQ